MVKEYIVSAALEKIRYFVHIIIINVCISMIERIRNQNPNLNYNSKLKNSSLELEEKLTFFEGEGYLEDLLLLYYSFIAE